MMLGVDIPNRKLLVHDRIFCARHDVGGRKDSQAVVIKMPQHFGRMVNRI